MRAIKSDRVSVDPLAAAELQPSFESQHPRPLHAPMVSVASLLKGGSDSPSKLAVLPCT
jgi:hypothetical protein